MVIGLNHCTAPLAMRERFWIGENRRYEVLRKLKSAEGIEEVVLLSTCQRTDFVVWASEPTLAANSLLQFLSSEHGLKLAEWQHFYRLLDDAALTHVFRVSSGLDSAVVGEWEIASQLEAAWEQAKTVGAAGRFVSAVVEKALAVARRVHSETKIDEWTVSVPVAACELAEQVFGSVEGRRVLLVGAGAISEATARQMVERGATSVVVIDESEARAKEVAERLHGTAATLADRLTCMVNADIVTSATGCPHVVLTREEAERVAEQRNRVALVILELGMPRDVDREVRRVDGILLYDLEGIERAVKGSGDEGSCAKQAVAAAEKLVSGEVLGFRGKMKVRSGVPTSVALRQRLEEICRQELESFIEERGPFTREQYQSLQAIAAQVIQKIANSLAHELKELPEREEQERMTELVARLFHLESPKSALAGAISQKTNRETKGDERSKIVAVH